MPDTSPKPKTREELEKEWWDRWWAEDYSWEGLAKKGTTNAPNETIKSSLQNWWTLNAGVRGPEVTEKSLLEARHLVRCPDDGSLWHVAHVPMFWRSGAPAKSAWSEQQLDLLYHALGYALESNRSAGIAQFQGAVCPDFGRVMIGSNLMGVNFDQSWIGDFSQMSGSLPTILLRRSFVEKLGTSTGHQIFDSADLSGSIVVASTSFPGASMSNLRIARCRFLAPLLLRGLEFQFGIDAEGAEFHQGCDFSKAFCRRNASFKAAKFWGSADFSDSHFAQDVSFKSTLFVENANFVLAKFSGRAEFRNSVFKGRAILGGIVSEGPIEFTNAYFATEMHFENAEFEDYADFASIKWPDDAYDFAGAFRNARFSASCVFDGAGFQSYSAFDKTQFQQGVSLNQLPEKIAESNFKIELSKFQADARAEVEVGTRASSERGALVALEGGCRALKTAMAMRSDRAREQLFYRFELMARNAQSSTPWQERWASKAYEAASDYGTSITRPLVVALFVWALFALVYVAHGVFFSNLTGAGLHTLWQGFGMSLSRTFMPFSAWSPSSLEGNALGLALIERGSVGLLSVWVQAMGTLQSFVSIVLFFLSGLALRRRFQIN